MGSKKKTSPVHDVAISGGGLVGLSLAAALGGIGARVAVVDRDGRTAATAAAYDGRSSAIAAGSRRVLQGVGAWDAIADRAGPILEIRVSDGASPLFLHYDHEDVGLGPLGHIVENCDLRRALWQRVGQLPNVEIREGAAVAGLEVAADRTALILDDGARVSARLAIAADGRNSFLRQAAGIEIDTHDYAQAGLVCTVAVERDHRCIAHERFLTPGPFAILPMTDNRASLVWTERRDLAARLHALDDAAYTDELTRRFGDFLGRVTLAGPRFSYPLSLVHARNYVAPRLALAGDAAHAIHPIAGQGFNLGLRDVAALAETVADTLRLGLDPGSAPTLDAYQKWRRFDSSVMLAVTDVLNRLFSNDIGPVRLARDVGLAAVDRAPGLKRLFMRHAMGLEGDLPRLVRGEAL